MTRPGGAPPTPARTGGSPGDARGGHPPSWRPQPTSDLVPVGPWAGAGPRRGAVPPWLLEVLFLVLVAVFFGALAKKWALASAPGDWVLTETGSSTSECGRGGRMNFLVMGIDSVEGTHRTDTMFLLGVDPAGKKVAIMSIPRDTRVVINGTGRKINEVMARYGEYVLRSMIENLMEIRINRAVKIDFQGFVKVIDLMGGVDVDIEHPMHYDDNWGKLHIHFDKGPAHLAGQKALEYVRFRGDPSADLGRIKRQQRFLAAVVNKLQTPAMVVRLPGIIAEALGHVETDLSLAEALDLASALRGGGISLQTMSLPGEARYVDKISFFLPYKDEALRIGAKHYSNLLVMELDAAFSVSSATVASASPGPDASAPEPLSASGPATRP